MTAFTPRGGLDHASRQPFVASKPTLVEMYAHKPLPPLPLNLCSHRPRPASPAAPASEPPGLRRSSKVSDAEASRPRNAPAPGSCRAHSRRRSSYKVQQLTGYDVDIADSPPASDCSSTHSLEWADCSYKLVPLLETDDGDAASSRGSSWEPVSPHPLLGSPRQDVAAPVLRSCSDASLPELRTSSEARRALGEEWMRRWDPSYGQFGDSKAAGEYHRIASEIAARHTSCSTQESLARVAGTEARARRPSLSVNFGRAAKLSPRRRNASHPADMMAARPRQTSSTQTVQPASPPSPRRIPVSAFDSDSSDGEARDWGGSGIREWFGRRSDEAAATADRPSPHLYCKGQPDEATPRTSKAGEQVRELLHQARDRARQLHMPREERRRMELRRHIRRIPC